MVVQTQYYPFSSDTESLLTLTYAKHTHNTFPKDIFVLTSVWLWLELQPIVSYYLGHTKRMCYKYLRIVANENTVMRYQLEQNIRLCIPIIINVGGKQIKV